MHKHTEIREPIAFKVGVKLKATFAILMFLGVLAFSLCLFQDAQRAWQAYLLGLFYFTSLAVVGLFYVAIQFLTKSGWSVLIRRLFESLTAYLPAAAILMAVMALFGGPTLYKWLQPEYVAKDAILQHKAAYLNSTFFWVRLGLFFGGWILFKKLIVGSSLLLDHSKEDSVLSGMVPKSVAYILFFALSYSFFSVDLIMSLEPHWFSTIFGVYLFGGTSQAFFALMILMTIFLVRGGYYNQMVNENHVHDLAKFMFGFTVFWAYIAFSQFMLIWYANIPEETLFFEHRMRGSWAVVSVLLIVLKFVVPFLALLPRWAKRDFNYLTLISILVLMTQVLDLHWLIYPNFNEHHALFSLWDLLIFGGFLGLFGFTVTRFLSQNSLIPKYDPFLQESADHEVHYG